MSSPKTFQDAESLYDRAARLELATDFAPAFSLYLEASDAFLHLSRSAPATPAFQARCNANALKAIRRAEKIKRATKSPGAQIGVVAPPTVSFGPDRQNWVLRNSSFINNIRYPLWNEPVPLPPNPGARYSDPNGQPTIPLSKTSSSAISWKKFPRNFSAPNELHSTLTPSDIDQNIIDDCSVCASVAVCVQHNQRFNSRLLSSSLQPGNQPGKYDLKAYLNGGCRRVPIDDLLPFDGSGCPIGISSGRKAIAWPALIEKAYMKLMGGYDFPGSNSSIDLRTMTGWIPEHIELQRTSFERERTWKRIANGFRNGHCVLTVGTDAKTMLKIEGVKLLPSHDYAVVDIRETKGERWLTLIDSRVPTTVSSLYAGLDSGLGWNGSRMLDMRWDDICATFEGIYASWDLGLFQCGPIFHGVWKPADSKDKTQASVRRLRLLYERQDSQDRDDDPLEVRKDIWTLLTRHFSDTRRGAEYISLTVQPEDEEDWKDMWLRTGDKDVKGPYTTSPHVMVRTRVEKVFHNPPSASISPTTISGALSVLASYDGPFDDIFFTLNVFCGADVRAWWDEDAGIGDSIAPGGGGFSVQVDGVLTTKNAGGNHTHPTYMLNPQWYLRVYEDDAGSSSGGPDMSRGKVSPIARSGENKTGQKPFMLLSAQGPKEVPLNVTAVWSSGERIVELAQKEVVTSSGAYSYGRARAVADMSPGTYTVILSAFEPQIHLGQFTLKIESSRRFDLEPIPQEGAGMYSRISKDEWGEHTAAGGPSHGRYHCNPIYEVRLPSSAKLSARLHLTSPAPTATLNLSLFPAPSSASEVRTINRPLASSGSYSNALSGVCIPARMLSPGSYWLVPSTFAAGVHASFKLVVYCSDADCVVSRKNS